MVKTCCMCQQPFVGEGKTFVLTEEEKVTAKAPDELHYCPACIKVMEDPETGAQFLKGSYEMQLREIGVPSSIAQGMAHRFYLFLKSKANVKAH